MDLLPPSRQLVLKAIRISFQKNYNVEAHFHKVTISLRTWKMIYVAVIDHPKPEPLYKLLMSRIEGKIDSIWQLDVVEAKSNFRCLSEMPELRNPARIAVTNH